MRVCAPNPSPTRRLQQFCRGNRNPQLDPRRGSVRLLSLLLSSVANRARCPRGDPSLKSEQLGSHESVRPLLRGPPPSPSDRAALTESIPLPPSGEESALRVT